MEHKKLQTQADSPETAQVHSSTVHHSPRPWPPPPQLKGSQATRVWGLRRAGGETRAQQWLPAQPAALVTLPTQASGCSSALHAPSSLDLQSPLEELITNDFPDRGDEKRFISFPRGRRPESRAGSHYLWRPSGRPIPSFTPFPLPAPSSTSSPGAPQSAFPFPRSWPCCLVAAHSLVAAALPFCGPEGVAAPAPPGPATLDLGALSSTPKCSS